MDCMLKDREEVEARITCRACNKEWNKVGDCNWRGYGRSSRSRNKSAGLPMIFDLK